MYSKIEPYRYHHDHQYAIDRDGFVSALSPAVAKTVLSIKSSINISLARNLYLSLNIEFKHELIRIFLCFLVLGDRDKSTKWKECWIGEQKTKVPVLTMFFTYWVPFPSPGLGFSICQVRLLGLDDLSPLWALNLRFKKKEQGILLTPHDFWGLKQIQSHTPFLHPLVIHDQGSCGTCWWPFARFCDFV